jgi:hypothetical protein
LTTSGGEEKKREIGGTPGINVHASSVLWGCDSTKGIKEVHEFKSS